MTLLCKSFYEPSSIKTSTFHVLPSQRLQYCAKYGRWLSIRFDCNLPSYSFRRSGIITIAFEVCTICYDYIWYILGSNNNNHHHRDVVCSYLWPPGDISCYQNSISWLVLVGVSKYTCSNSTSAQRPNRSSTRKSERERQRQQTQR